MVGFTSTKYTTFEGHLTQTIPAISYNVGDFASVQAALNAVKATGGVLNFAPATTYNISSRLTLNAAARVRIVGNGATILAGVGIPVNDDIFTIDGSRNYAIYDLTIDCNRAVRGAGSGTGVGLLIKQANSILQGGGGASLVRVNTPNSNWDGIRIVDHNSSGLNPNTYSQNVLVYKCTANNCRRLGLAWINCRNIQTLGGDFDDNGTPPNGGMPAGNDCEPDGTSASPGIEDCLFEGCRFRMNVRTGMSLSSVGGTEEITVRGCLFEGGNTDPMPAGNLSHGAGISVKCARSHIHHNIFTGFGAHYSVLFSLLLLHSPGSVDNLVENNLFVDNTATIPSIMIHSNIGGVNTVINNRFSNNGGANVQNSGGAIVSGSENSSTPFPPAAPWDVTFAEEGGSGGSIPTFGAKLGEAVEANATAGTSTTVAVTPTVAAGAMLLVPVCFRDAQVKGQVVSSVIFDPGGANERIGTRCVGSEGGTEAAISQGTNTRRSEVWKILNPPAVLGNVVATYSESVGSARVTVYQYNGVENIGNLVVAFGAQDTDPLVTIESSRLNSLMFCAVSVAGGAATPHTPVLGTERTDGTTGAAAGADTSFSDLELDAPTLGSYTFSTTPPINGEWAAIAIEMVSAASSKTIFPSGLSTTFARGGPIVKVDDTVVVISPSSFSASTALGTPTIVDTEDIFIDLTSQFIDIAFTLGEVPPPVIPPVVTVTASFTITFQLNNAEFVIGWLADAPITSSWEEDTPL